MSSRRGARPQIKSHTNPRKAQRMWVFGNRISRIDTCVTRPYSSLSQIQKSRPVDSRVCFLYARFIYKTKRLIAPQHNRLIVFNSSFSKLYRDVGIFSGQSNICQPFRQRCVLGHRLYKGSTFLFKATHHTSVSRERARCDRLYIPTRLLMYNGHAAPSPHSPARHGAARFSRTWRFRCTSSWWDRFCKDTPGSCIPGSPPVLW